MGTNRSKTPSAGFRAFSVLILSFILIASAACGDDAQKVRDQSLSDAGVDAFADDAFSNDAFVDNGADASQSGQQDAGPGDATASDAHGVPDARQPHQDAGGADAVEEDVTDLDAGTQDVAPQDATPDSGQDVADDTVDDIGPDPEPDVAEPTTCTNGDGVCPAGCDALSDNDCQLDCRDASTWPAGWVAFEDEVLRLTNLERAAGATCGGQSYPAVGALTANAKLREAARCHSQDMADNSNMSHTGSDGSDPGARIRRAGYQSGTWGENIAAGYTTPAEVVAGWMNSSGHCKNIMKSQYTELGVGYWLFSSDPARYKHYWTQNFGRPR